MSHRHPHTQTHTGIDCDLFLCRAIPVTLTLQDPHYPDVDLGTLELTVTLRPKDGSIEEPHRDATVSVTPPLTH